MTEVRLMDAKRVISRKIEQAQCDAADAAKWRAVEPLLREWVEAEAAECTLKYSSAPVNEMELIRLTGRRMDAEQAIRSLLAENVNQGLTKEGA